MSRTAFTLCWAVKGGSGTTVVAATMGLVAERPALLVDLAGDLPAVLGMAEPPGAGLHDWIASGTAPERLEHLAVEVTAGVRLIAAGTTAARADDPRWAALGAWLSACRQSVVVDAGTGIPPRGLREQADASLLVTRACFVALRRAAMLPYRPSGVVLVEEPGRALGRIDVEASVGAPVAATVAFDPGVARSVDSGMLTTRPPRVFQRRLRGVA